MTTIGFHPTGDGKPKADVLTYDDFKAFATGGITPILDVETDIGGFRFLHAFNDQYQAKYCIMYFFDKKGKPTIFELPLKQFHNYITYWLLHQQILDERLDYPKGKPTPLENLKYCLMAIATNGDDLNER